MQGHFDLALLNTPGLTRELIEAVRREGGHPAVERYLREQTKEGEWKTDNLVLKTAPSWFYYQAISGPSRYGNWAGGSFGSMAYVVLATTASEPSYTGDVYTVGYTNAASLPDGSGISAPRYKKFINDCIVPQEIKIDPSGREAIYGKFKWLYLPGEATNSLIRSATIYGASTSNPDSSEFTRWARVRIKDSGGNPVTIVKGATKSLLVEYTFTLPSL